MILVLTERDLVERARHKGSDAVELSDVAGIERLSGDELARTAERVVYVKTPRFKVLKDRTGSRAGYCGYVTSSSGRSMLSTVLALWAEEDAAR